MDKKVYTKPTLKVVVFHVESGFASSLMGSSHEGFSGDPLGLEGFLGELHGHEYFIDITDDFSESDYWNY